MVERYLVSKDPFIDGSVTLTNAGQVYALSGSQVKCDYILVAAHPSNVGTVWMGGRNVVAGSGLPLTPAALPLVALPAVRPYTIGLIGDSAGDAVTFIMVTALMEAP